MEGLRYLTGVDRVSSRCIELATWFHDKTLARAFRQIAKAGRELKFEEVKDCFGRIKAGLQDSTYRSNLEKKLAPVDCIDRLRDVLKNFVDQDEMLRNGNFENAVREQLKPLFNLETDTRQEDWKLITSKTFMNGVAEAYKQSTGQEPYPYQT